MNDNSSIDGEDAATAAGPVEAASDTDRTRDWLLVGTLLLTLVVVPWALILFPTVRAAVGTLGLPFRDVYLVVPLIPALGLGVVAVWAALRSGGP